MKVTGKLSKTEKRMIALAAAFLALVLLLRLGAVLRAARTDYTVTAQKWSAEPAGGELVNINTAGAEELETLDGIGPALAQRIIAYRYANGPFKSVDDLLLVKGIGPAALENFRHRVTVD